LLERLLPHANNDTKSWARADPDFYPLHGYPRWQKVLELMS